jgi:hypothetical protein
MGAKSARTSLRGRSKRRKKVGRFVRLSDPAIDVPIPERPGEIQFLADRLNSFREHRPVRKPLQTEELRRRMGALPPGWAEYEAWEVAEKIMEECQGVPAEDPLPSGVVRRFNALTREVPVNLYIGERGRQDRRETYPWIEPTMDREPRGFVLQILWGVLTQSRARDRLKQCPRCQRWFVDRTKNKGKARCSESCTWRYWNRTRRKEARHNQYRRKGSTVRSR